MSKSSPKRHVWHDAAEEVGIELKQIHALSAVMRGQLEVIARYTEAAAFDLAQRLQAMDDAVADGQGVEQVGGMVMDALASMQFQDIVRQQTETVIDALDRLEGHADALCERLQRFDDKEFSFKPLAQHLDELFAAYVMPAQRETHENALKGKVVGQRDPNQLAEPARSAVPSSPPSTPPKTELF